MFFKDHLNNTIQLNNYPQRLVSLVPSQSELLWDLDLKNELKGITKFCIHPPEMFRTVKRVGGTKQLNLEAIRSLEPDLIVGNKEENELVQIEELKKEFPVWMSDIYNLNDALGMITGIGQITNRVEQADALTKKIEDSFLQLKQTTGTVLYLIWKEPFMAAGRYTFIGDMLKRMGLINVIKDDDSRYPQLSQDEIKHLNPDFIFLSTEPYPFKAKHIAELQSVLPNANIRLVDGELFSWYGSRLLHSVAYLNQLTAVL